MLIYLISIDADLRYVCALFLEWNRDQFRQIVFKISIAKRKLLDAISI